MFVYFWNNSLNQGDSEALRIADFLDPSIRAGFQDDEEIMHTRFTATLAVPRIESEIIQ